jgi:hypothetical protein
VISGKVECKIRVPEVSTIRVKSEVGSSENPINVFFLNLGSPIIVDDTGVNFNESMMEEGRWYPFLYNNETYLAVKTSKKTINIYKVKRS